MSRMVSVELKTLIEGKRWILENSTNADLINTTKIELEELLRNVKTLRSNSLENSDEQMCAAVLGICIPLFLVNLYIYLQAL